MNKREDKTQVDNQLLADYLSAWCLVGRNPLQTAPLTHEIRLRQSGGQSTLESDCLDLRLTQKECGDIT